jgi:TonB family protein
MANSGGCKAKIDEDIPEKSSKPLFLVHEVQDEWVPGTGFNRPTYGVEKTGLLRFYPEEPKAAAGSFLVHALALALFFIHPKPEPIPEKPQESTVTISLIADNGKNEDASKAQAPKKEEEKKEEKEEKKEIKSPSEEPSDEKIEQEEPQKEQKASSEENAENEGEKSDKGITENKIGDAGGGGLIWTPPPPQSQTGSKEGEAREEIRVELPKVEIPKGASEPLLLSYDQARYSDAVAVSEATRLMNSGMIIMSVSVDEKGDVTDCFTTISSGSPLLDERACDLVKSYKYRPAQNEKGQPYKAMVSEMLEWAKDGKFSDTQSDADLKSNPGKPQAGKPAGPILEKRDPMDGKFRRVESPVITNM